MIQSRELNFFGFSIGTDTRKEQKEKIVVPKEGAGIIHSVMHAGY